MTDVFLTLAKLKLQQQEHRVDFFTRGSKNPVSDILKEGQWRGQRCFIVGGGKSLSGFDFSKLKGEKVIAINCAFMKVEPDIVISSDSKFYSGIYDGTYGDEIRKRFMSLKCPKVFLNVANYPYGDDVYLIDCAGEKSFNFEFGKGFGHGANSGYVALQLAATLGASPIYLLGYDMKGEAGKQVWWHNYYPDNQGAQVYERMKRNFEHLPPLLSEKGIEVYNLNPDSALEVFPKIKFDDVGKNKIPLIVSYYTKGSIYEHIITRLEASLKRLSISYKFYERPHLSNWHENTCQKAGVILEALNEFPTRDILFIDADAIIWEFPFEYFCSINCDIGARYWKGQNLLSGTLYLKNTDMVKDVVNEWVIKCAENVRNDNVMEQQFLGEIIARKNISVHRLSKDWCWIDGSGLNCYSQIRPVGVKIEHFQISRLTRWGRYKNAEQ